MPLHRNRNADRARATKNRIIESRFRQVVVACQSHTLFADINRFEDQGDTQLASTIDDEEMQRKASALAHRGSGQWLINNELVKQLTKDMCGFL